MWAVSAVDRATSIARRFPVFFLLGTTLIALMAAGALSASWYGALVRHLGVTWPEIAALELWRVPTSSLVQEDTGVVWAILLLLPVLAVAERRFGPARTLATYVLVDAISTAPVLAALALAGAAGSAPARRLADTPNLGSSAGLVGLLAAWIATLGGRARRLSVVALGIVLAGALAFDWELAAVQHAVAAIAGATVGLWLSPRRRRAVQRDAAGRAP